MRAFAVRRIHITGALASRKTAVFLVWALIGFLFLPACSEKAEEKPDVIILHSGRMRGNVYPLSLQNIAPLQHYQYLAGYIKKVRDEAKATGAKVLLVDLGDSLMGSFASHVTDCENMVTFFNDTGYDALLLSNLDYSVNPEVLSRLKAKVLNPFQDPSGQPATANTTFGAKIELGNTPVFLLANFYGDTSSEQFPERFPTWFGSTPTDVSPVRDYQKVLESLGPRPAGSLTLLNWMKFESPTEPPEGFLQKLRQLGINAILAHRIYGSRERDVWSQSGYYDWNPPASMNILRNNGGFALARLDLKREGDGWKVLKHELLPITANTAPSDQAIVKAISQYAAPITAADAMLLKLSRKVSEQDILMAYMTALTMLPGTQAVLYSPQSIRSEWLEGELRASQVFNSLPWTTGVAQVTLTPEQLAKALENPIFVLLKRDDMPDGPVTVTTSKYFASVLAAHLKLSPESVRETPQTSEFDYFVSFLRSTPEALNGGEPAGWSVVRGKQP